VCSTAMSQLSFTEMNRSCAYKAFIYLFTFSFLDLNNGIEGGT